MRISDWSSDVCSSDLREMIRRQAVARRRFARVGVDRRNLETLGEGFDLTFGVTKVRNVAERDEVQAVAGRADFLVHLHPALQLLLVPVRPPYAVAGKFQVLGMLVKLVRNIGFISEWRREVIEHPPGSDTTTNEKHDRTH